MIDMHEPLKKSILKKKSLLIYSAIFIVYSSLATDDFIDYI